MMPILKRPARGKTRESALSGKRGPVSQTPALGRQKVNPFQSKPGGRKMSTVETNKRAAQKEEVKGPLAESQAGAADLAGGGNLDKIREILFGVQMRESEKKLARLEERLLKESSDMREEIRKRFDALEVYIKKEVESLSARLKAEQEERTGSDKEVAREIKDLSKITEKKISQIDDQTAKNQRELRQQILDQSKSMTDEIRQKVEQMSALLERRVQELRSEKADRSALASLFTEMAVRLNDEFRLPGKE